MGRPRKYGSNAERQAAYRRRYSHGDLTELSQEQRDWIADQLEPLVNSYAFPTDEMHQAIGMLRNLQNVPGVSK